MKLSKIFSSFASLGSAASQSGQTHQVASSGSQLGYLAISDGAKWQSMSPVFEGLKANLPAVGTVPIGAVAVVTDVFNLLGQAGVRFVNNGTDWVKAAELYNISPLEFAGAKADGATNITAQVQAAMDVSKDFQTPSYVYGRGKEILSPPGVVYTGPTQLSTWSSLHSAGGQGSSVWVVDHTNITETTALLKARSDADQQSSIGSQPLIDGMMLNGNKGDATYEVHGYFAPELVGDKDDAPFFIRTQFCNFSGDGIKIGKFHNQIRATSLKSIANDGWGLNLDKSSDSKMNQVGFGRNLAGQVYMKNCASMKLAQFDIWTPGGGIFAGEWALQLISCRNTQFTQGELQGVVRIEGGNINPSDKTKDQVTNIIFSDFNIKVSPETYEGIQYTGGGGAKSYDAMVNVRGANGVKFIGGAFGYSQGPATVDEIAATPKYIWEFTVPGDQDYEKTAGFVEVSCVDMIHIHGVLGDSTPEIPMSKHWSNDPKRVIIRGDAPGIPVLRHTTQVTINLIPAQGQTVDTDDYPLLWLGLDFGRNWANRPLTFVVPDMSAMPVGPGQGWYYVTF